MIIKKLSMENFRQFAGRQTIIFSTNENQNITLILGDNTSGKTTLLQAFLWCFYGNANFRSKDSLLNAKIAQEMLQDKKERDICISIELEHHGIDYIITRNLTHYIKGNEVKANTISKVVMTYKQDDGQTKEIPSHQVLSKINEILPEDLAIYFLYDTERFGNITTRSDVTSSVKGILGLTVLDNVVKHIGSTTNSRSVLYQFNSGLNLEGNKKAEEAYKKYTDAQEHKETILQRLEQKKVERQAYLKAIEEKRVILRNLAGTAALQKQKEEKEEKYIFEQKALNEAEQLFFTSFKNNAPMFLGQGLYKRAMEELKDAKLDKKAIRDMNANAIKDIIDRGVCVCGTIITEGNSAFEHLLEEIRYLPPESIGTLIRGFQDKADSNIKSGENYFIQLEQSYKGIYSHQSRIGELEDEIESLNDELKDKDNVEKHQSMLLEFEEKYKGISTDIDNLNQKLGELERIIKENKEIYEVNIKQSERNQALLTYIKYAEEVLDWVIKRRNTREKDIKVQLEDRVNFYFAKMYHGKRKVSIDDRFKVTLITTDLSEDIQTDESQGLETVKNFAFISGLVDLAKEKLKDAYEKDAEAYPLILDAPFSNADEIHVKNISEVLPNVANQLILIVMAKDWNYAKSSLENRVGKEYFLNKHSEIYTELCEVKINV